MQHLLRHVMNPPGFETEILYSFIIIICSLMIYFGTKELYELSSHKGIKYFREAFLFFALAYFFRSFIKYILISFGITKIIDFSPNFPREFMLFASLFSKITLFIFIYLSSMAIFYLLYSFMWKQWNENSKKIYIFHTIAIIISIISISINTNLTYLILNSLLLIFIFFIVLTASKKRKKKKNKLYPIYILLFIFWILNIIDILVPEFLKTFQLFIYLSSSGIFLLILYKVIKKIGPN